MLGFPNGTVPPESRLVRIPEGGISDARYQDCAFPVESRTDDGDENLFGQMRVLSLAAVQGGGLLQLPFWMTVLFSPIVIRAPLLRGEKKILCQQHIGAIDCRIC